MLLEFKVQGQLDAIPEVVNLAFTEIVKNRDIAGVKAWREVIVAETCDKKEFHVPALEFSAYPSKYETWEKFPVPLNEAETAELILRWLNVQDKTILPSDKWADSDVYGFRSSAKDQGDVLFRISPVLIGIGK